MADSKSTNSNQIDLDEIRGMTVDKKPTNKVQATLDKSACVQILQNLASKKKLDSVNQAMVLVTGLVQNGGSNRNAGTSVNYGAFDKSLSTSDLIASIREINKNATIRQFCRGLATEIAQVAEIIGEEGDLSKQMRLEDPNLTFADAVWCSNFQTINPECPEKVRKWLSKNFSERFNK